MASTRIALEAGGHSAWVAELLGELGHGVIGANGRSLRMIFQSDSKNDRLGADLLFSFITKVYERRSLIVTSNSPFARWNEVFHDATAAAAVIDRIVHHATILKTEGKSYRPRDAERTASRRKSK